MPFSSIILASAVFTVQVHAALFICMLPSRADWTIPRNRIFLFANMRTRIAYGYCRRMGVPGLVKIGSVGVGCGNGVGCSLSGGCLFIFRLVWAVTNPKALKRAIAIIPIAVIKSL